MAFVHPNEPNWDKKARENNPNLNLPPMINHSTPIDESMLVPGAVTGTVIYDGVPLYNGSHISGNSFYSNSTSTMPNSSGRYIIWGSNGWEWLSMEDNLNKDQQEVFDYLSKVMQFITK